METIHLTIRWIVATWIVLVGVVYGLASIGATAAVPSRSWNFAVMAVLCVKAGQSIASEKRFPF